MSDQDFGHLCRGRRIHVHGQSDFGILSNLGASSIITWAYADTLSACPSQSGSLAMTSITFAAVICADEPCSVKSVQVPESSFTVSPRSTTRPSNTWNLGSNVHQCSKVGFPCVSLCFQNNFLFALNFLQLPCWIRFELLPFLVHCCFRIRNSHRLEHRNKLLHFNCILCLRFDLHGLSAEMISNVVSGTPEPPRCMHALFFWMLVGFTTLRFSVLKAGALLCSFCARHCRLHWNFQLSPCVFDGLFMFTIFRIDEINAFQPFEHCRVLASLFWAAFPILVHTSGGSCLNFHQITFINLEVSLSMKWTLWTLSKNLINFDPRPHFHDRQYVFLATHPDLHK